MAIKRTRERKENPHYNFVYSWDEKQPSQAHVKGEHDSGSNLTPQKFRHDKKAVSLAQEGSGINYKKGILRSIVLFSFIVILTLVIYLAWNKFILS